MVNLVLFASIILEYLWTLTFCIGLNILNTDCSTKEKLYSATLNVDGRLFLFLGKSPIRWTHVHVKGHQDDNPFAVLDRWATLNVEMDFKAKLHLAQNTDPSLHDSQFGVTGEPWALWIGERKICCDPDQHVTDHIRGDICRGYWDSKNRFGAGSSASVNWDATQQAMLDVKRSRRHWVTKHTTGYCGVNNG